MTITKKDIKAAAKRVAEQARIAGKKAAKRMVAAGDAALVKAGHAAERRQRARAVKAGLTTAAKAAVVAGAAAVGVVAVQAAIRKVRDREPAKA
jgi:hypothetical protein